MKIILTSICSNLALTSLSERRLIVCWNFNICCSSRATSSMLRHRMFTPSDRYFSFLSLRLKVLILSSWTVLNRKPVTKYCSFKSYKTAVISAQNNTVYATKHHTHTHTHTHTHSFNGPLSGTTQVSRYQKGKTNLDFTEARQWVAVASAEPYTNLHIAPDK